MEVIHNRDFLHRSECLICDNNLIKHNGSERLKEIQRSHEGIVQDYQKHCENIEKLQWKYIVREKLEGGCLQFLLPVLEKIASIAQVVFGVNKAAIQQEGENLEIAAAQLQEAENKDFFFAQKGFGISCMRRTKTFIRTETFMWCDSGLGPIVSPNKIICVIACKDLKSIETASGHVELYYSSVSGDVFSGGAQESPKIVRSCIGGTLASASTDIQVQESVIRKISLVSPLWSLCGSGGKEEEMALSDDAEGFPRVVLKSSTVDEVEFIGARGKVFLEGNSTCVKVINGDICAPENSKV